MMRQTGHVSSWKDRAEKAACKQAALDRHSLTSKIFAFLLSAVILFGMSSMSVFAIENNPSGKTVSEVPSGETMSVNTGTVEKNNGKITTNNGTVNVNNGGVGSKDSIETNNGTVVTNNGTINRNNSIIQDNTNGFIFTNYGNVNSGRIQDMHAGTATYCTIDSMEGGTATKCLIQVEMKNGTAIDCDMGNMSGGTATNCNINYMTNGTAAGGSITTMGGGTATNCIIKTVMLGGTATECDIKLEMRNGTAIDSTIKKMTGGTARGANTVIEDYKGGDVSNLVPLANIKDGSGNHVAEENVNRVEAIPAEMPDSGSTPEPVIPESPYRVFLFDTVPQVKNAAQGATLKLELDAWNALPLWFMKEIAARRDVTIHMTYRYEGLKYDVTFPAGMVINCQDDEGKEINYFGPLKLADMAIRAKASCVVTK